jgi:hypothetical protein
MSSGLWYDANIMHPKIGSEVFVDTDSGRMYVYYGEHGYEIPIEWWTISKPVVLRWRYGRA